MSDQLLGWHGVARGWGGPAPLFRRPKAALSVGLSAARRVADSCRPAFGRHLSSVLRPVGPHFRPPLVGLACARSRIKRWIKRCISAILPKPGNPSIYWPSRDFLRPFRYLLERSPVPAGTVPDSTIFRASRGAAVAPGSVSW